METNGIHELTAAYALSALDAKDEREYEEHLRHCARCREDLASLQEAAAGLAYAVEGPGPPPRLREQILEQARSERANVVPFRRRRYVVPALAAAAAAAAGVAIGLGLWGSSLSGSLDDERAARAEERTVLALAAEPDASRYPVSGADGTLVVAPDGQAALLVNNLDEAPEEMLYEIWVIEDDTPKPAGVIQGGGERSVAALTRAVSAGDTVAVTLEESFVEAPQGEVLFTAQPV